MNSESFVTGASYTAKGFTVLSMWNDGDFQVDFDYLEECNSAREAVKKVRYQTPHWGSMYNISSRKRIILCVVAGYHPEFYTNESLGDVRDRSTIYVCAECGKKSSEFMSYSSEDEKQTCSSFKRYCTDCREAV